MPSWKKVIVSGSNAHLNEVTASRFVGDGSGLTNTKQKTNFGIRITTQDIYIQPGLKGFRHIPYDCDITKVRGVANETGSIIINIKRNNVVIGNYSLSNQTGSIDTTLNGWTTQLNNNDLIEFYVSQSSTYITDISVFIDLESR